MRIEENRMMLGGLSADDLCARFGSPLYVYDEEVIRARAAQLLKVFTWRPFRVHYALKANFNPALVRIIREEGCGADAVSPFEVLLALEAGMQPADVVFTGDNATDEDMAVCLERGVIVNAGSLQQLEKLGRLAPGARAAIRVNPDVGGGHHDHCITGGPHSKFGIYHDRLREAMDIARTHKLRLVGLHSHIGSGILEAETFLTAMEVTLACARQLPDLEFVDFGGGLGIPYRRDQAPLNLEGLGRRVSARFQEFCAAYGRQLELKIEPGRFLVAQSGTLLARVVGTKETPAHHFVGCDTGFGHLIRPMAYGSHHRIINASRVEGPLKEGVLCGNLCESGDVFTQNDDGIENRLLDEFRPGDVVALMDAGAYGMSMSMQYNLRARPAEVLVRQGREPRLIRRRETYEDLLRSCRVD